MPIIVLVSYSIVEWNIIKSVTAPCLIGTTYMCDALFYCMNLLFTDAVLSRFVVLQILFTCTLSWS